MECYSTNLPQSSPNAPKPGPVIKPWLSELNHSGNANILIYITYNSLASADDLLWLLWMMSRNRGEGGGGWLHSHYICSLISQLNKYCQDDWNFRPLTAQGIQQQLCLVLPLSIQSHVLYTVLHKPSGEIPVNVFMLPLSCFGATGADGIHSRIPLLCTYPASRLH